MSITDNPLSQTPCVCGSVLYDRVFQGKYQRGLEGDYEFSLWKCRKCALVRTFPIPGVELYTSGYSHSTDTSGEYAAQDKPGNVPLASYLKNLVAASPEIAGETVLDVGCNGGELVVEMQRNGLKAEGCDVDPVAVEYGIKQGLTLFCQDLSFNRPEKNYGAVTLIHTLEHIVPATGFLENIASALLPGGLLHVRVPNFGGWIPQLMKENWGFLMPPLHVWQFTPDTLQSCVERVDGLKLAEVKCNRTLEPKSGGMKGLLKNVVMSSAAQFDHGDEIIATFKKH